MNPYKGKDYVWHQMIMDTFLLWPIMNTICEINLFLNISKDKFTYIQCTSSNLLTYNVRDTVNRKWIG